jgi:hypothetical protein
MSPGKVLKILKQLKAKHTNSANAESFIVVGYCDEMGRLPRKESEALSTLHKWSVIVKEFRKFKVVPRNLSTQVARQMDVMQQEVLMVKSVLKRLRGH